MVEWTCDPITHPDFSPTGVCISGFIARSNFHLATRRSPAQSAELTANTQTLIIKPKSISNGQAYYNLRGEMKHTLLVILGVSSDTRNENSTRRQTKQPIPQINF